MVFFLAIISPNWLKRISRCVKYARIWVFADPRFCPSKGKYGSEKTRVLAYFTQCHFLRKLLLGSFIQYVRKIFRKTSISYPLIRTYTCVYQGVRNVSFSEDFVNILNECSPSIQRRWKLNLRKNHKMINPYFLSLSKPEGVLKAFFWLTFGEKRVLKSLSGSKVILILHSTLKGSKPWLFFGITKKHPKSA